MFRKILLAYDGTLEGAQALREGALLARACGAEVVLLCVAPETAGIQMAEGLQGGVVAQIIESHKAILERAMERLKSLGFHPTARLELGEPAPTIGRVARETKADLVVVGHRRQNFFSRWWSGSNNAYLSEHIGCSLLMSSNSISDEAFEKACARAQEPEPA